MSFHVGVASECPSTKQKHDQMEKYDVCTACNWSAVAANQQRICPNARVKLAADHVAFELPPRSVTVNHVLVQRSLSSRTRRGSNEEVGACDVNTLGT